MVELELYTLFINITCTSSAHDWSAPELAPTQGANAERCGGTSSLGRDLKSQETYCGEPRDWDWKN